MSDQEPQERTGVSPPADGRSAEARTAALLRWLAGVEAELWAVVALLMLGDVVLTAYGLALGLSESNPVAAAVLDSHGVGGLTVLKGIVLACGGIGTRLLPASTSVVVPLGLLLPTLAAVVVNLVLIAAVGPV
jgi:hypothetical protein